MVRPLRVLVVGYGSIGRRHLGNLRALGCGELAVFRSRPSDAPGPEGVEVYFDLEPALAWAQAVVIANPTSLHVPVALQAAAAGRHLFIEKPLADSLEGLAALEAEVAARGLTAMVAYQLRFHPLIERAGALLAEGAIGRVWGARSWCAQYLPDWHPQEDYRTGYMARRELGGGVILTLSHELDYMRALLGPVGAVSACAGQPSALEMDTESWADLHLRFESGVPGHVHLDCLRRPASRGFELTGSDGLLEGDLLSGELRLHRGGGVERIAAAPADPNQPYLDALAHFLACVETGRTPIVSLAEGRAALELALGAQVAAREGRRVTLER